MYTQNSKSQKSVGPSEPSRSEKSRSRQQLEKTPSAIIHPNPYVEELADRSTSKKRRDASPFVPPILLEQNKQLIAENRQMAVIVHEKEAAVEAMQLKLNQRAEAEIAIFREVEAEKKRLIQEILQHKQHTDQQMAALTQEVTTLQQEKATLELQFQAELKKQELSIEQDRKRELDQVRLQHQQAITLLKAEAGKLRDELERRSNEAQIRELEARQQLNESNGRFESLTDEIKHLQQLRRLEQADQKTHYEARIQKIHLENRREKELFLIEHDSQIKRLEEECKRLRAVVVDLETAKQNLRETVDIEKGQREDYQEKVQFEAAASIDHIRKVSIEERTKLEGLLKAELALMESSTGQEADRLAAENGRMADLVGMKQREIERLLRQIDELREEKLAEMEQNERVIRELESKLLGALLEGEGENEALKTKLARLRDADITGLRDYYHHQIELLTQRVDEREQALAAARDKHHEQLRRKIEMRKGFDLEALRFKTRIVELQSELEAARARGKQLEDQLREQAEAASQEAEREGTSKTRVEQSRGSELRNLQAIITAKDAEIEELTNRLNLLKEHHALERAGWQAELQAEQQQHQLTKTERTRAAEAHEADTARLKAMAKQEQEELGRDLQLLKEEHRADFDGVVQEMATQREQNEDERQGLLLQIKKRDLEIEKLSQQLAAKEKELEALKEAAKEEKMADFSREREQLEDFYQQKLSLKEAESADLQQRVEELTSDLRDARENYNDLERRMEQLIESQSELREVERRVIQLGKENNLTKNLHEINK